jgi:hypothetical protein
MVTRRTARDAARLAGFGPRTAIGAALVLVCAACGTDATGVTSCKQIEDARCRRATACGIALQPPYSTSGSSVDECIRFYDTACLHGLETGDPGPVVVGQCVAAITDGGCGVVAAPQSSPACAWLVPAGQTNDAAATAVDAGSGDADAQSPD